ncbi:MAG: alpha/beta hydrolase [Deltaproteobacteria bacterium]
MTKELEGLVHIDALGARLEGSLTIPKHAEGIVLFAHGSGSSRKSPRNNFVAEILHASCLATLLIDLLTRDEDRSYETRFDIDLLSDRLVSATRWLAEEDSTKGLVVGYFGASTGAAAALQASISAAVPIGAIVSRGGRPDLAEPCLSKVKAPTLLVVGAKDEIVLGLNKKAYAMLNAPKDLVVVPGATHLFEEQGTLEAVADLAASWFKKYLHPVTV